VEINIYLTLRHVDLMQLDGAESLGTAVSNGPIVPAPDGECGAVGGMRTGRGNPKWQRIFNLSNTLIR
jgi:hypothetical protein